MIWIINALTLGTIAAWAGKHICKEDACKTQLPILQRKLGTALAFAILIKSALEAF